MSSDGDARNRRRLEASDHIWLITGVVAIANGSILLGLSIATPNLASLVWIPAGAALIAGTGTLLYRREWRNRHPDLAVAPIVVSWILVATYRLLSATEWTWWTKGSSTAGGATMIVVLIAQVLHHGADADVPVENGERRPA